MAHRATAGLCALATCGAVLCGSAPCHAEPPKTAIKYVAAKDLAAAVAANDAGLVARELAADAGATTLVIGRNRSGEVEVHTVLNEIIIVETGHAAMLVGGQVNGNHAISPTEWRGGEILGAARYELAAGDLLLIPAGVPHQCIVAGGDSLLYLTIKTPSAAPAAAAR